MTRRDSILYIVLLAAAFLISVLAGMTMPAIRIDNLAYDWLMSWHEPYGLEPRSILLAIDAETLKEFGGVGHLRDALADGLERISSAGPRVVACDMVLTDSGDDQQNTRLATALSRVPAVLSADLTDQGAEWEMPIEAFRSRAIGVGHVHLETDRYDGASREIALEKASGMRRLWALSLEAYRWWVGGQKIQEDQSEVSVGGRVIPGSRSGGQPRPILIRFMRKRVAQVSVAQLRAHPELAQRFAGRPVFAGVTDMSATRDRVQTPFDFMSGVEVNAQAFETLARGDFLTRARDSVVALVCLLMTAAAGLICWRRSGWGAVLLGLLVPASAHTLPHVLYAQSIVFPHFAPIMTAWLSFGAAFVFQHFVVRRRLAKSEHDRARYQQAIHFVAHEMRSPLTAIQGSSELMGRYNLNDEKRKQMASMINSESKRLARMIQTFLDVERLSEGQMELRRSAVDLPAVVEICAGRARPLAERKQMSIELAPDLEGVVEADRELLEYAVYNLLNNAVKYSPAETRVTVSSRVEHGMVRVSVHDQGIGMDEKELKNIFRKFYRTRKAEASGEAGTGIGLSLVDQIVTHHGGRMEVTSAPGKGSCFTIVLPAAAPASRVEGPGGSASSEPGRRA